MNIGAELDQQIQKEGTPTWGCNGGWLAVEDVKKCFRDIELRMLKKFGANAGIVLNTIIWEEIGRKLR